MYLATTMVRNDTDYQLPILYHRAQIKKSESTEYLLIVAHGLEVRASWVHKPPRQVCYSTIILQFYYKSLIDNPVGHESVL